MSITELTNICEEICIQVRNRIIEKKGITGEYSFEGDCNVACMLFYTYMRRYVENQILAKAAEMAMEIPWKYCFYDVTKYANTDPDTIVNVELIHGEQMHTDEISEDEWYIEHTWLVVTSGEDKLYVDPTSSQFKCLYNDIPDYYVSTEKPRWYLPDSENPEFNKNIAGT